MLIKIPATKDLRVQHMLKQNNFPATITVDLRNNLYFTISSLSVEYTMEAVAYDVEKIFSITSYGVGGTVYLQGPCEMSLEGSGELREVKELRIFSCYDGWLNIPMK